jgi:hypothetical protein
LGTRKLGIDLGMFTGVSTGLLILGLVVVLLVPAVALALRHAPQRERRVVYVQSSRADRQGPRRTVVR